MLSIFRFLSVAAIVLIPIAAIYPATRLYLAPVWVAQLCFFTANYLGFLKAKTPALAVNAEVTTTTKMTINLDERAINLDD